MVNHQVRTLGPVMNRLASTGVYIDTCDATFGQSLSQT
jgi:hypothetical protein